MQILEDDTKMPPNIADTRFRLVPKLQFAEKEQYDMAKSGVVKRAGESSREGEDIAMRKRWQSWQEEHANNISEVRQRQGKKLRFGDMLQLQHVVTGLFITLHKAQASEHGNKRVRLTDGSQASVFLLEPAFKTYSTGDQVRSGDQVVFRSAEIVNGEYLYLNMSRNITSRFVACTCAGFPSIGNGSLISNVCSDHRRLAIPLSNASPDMTSGPRVPCSKKQLVSSSSANISSQLSPKSMLVLIRMLQAAAQSGGL